MTTTVYTKEVNLTNLLEDFVKLYNSDKALANIIETYPETRKGLVYKVGKYTGKTINYFKSAETRTGILLATWIAETVAYAITFIILLSTGAVITAALWTALYTYVSYAFFSMLKDAIIANKVLKGI